MNKWYHIAWIRWTIAAVYELPQLLIALILEAFFTLKKRIVFSYVEKGVKYVILTPDTKISGVALGPVVFISLFENHALGEYTRNHEYGHTVQSLILGPLYLLIVGLPSFINLVTHAQKAKTFSFERYRHYFTCFPENWADQIGQVNLDHRISRLKHISLAEQFLEA